MTPATAEQIEIWLYQQHGWVTLDHVCSRWDISDRRLRHLGSAFLISRPGGGYIHRYHATPAELDAFCAPELAHSRTLRRRIFLLRRLYRERRRPIVDEPPTIQPSLL